MNIKRIRLDHTDSTNHYLQSHKEGNECDADIVAVTAEYQSDGHGQGSNNWESERGKNLLCSLLVRPKGVKAAAQYVLSMGAALSVMDALAAYTADISVKWPNDIYYKDRKICGILITCSLSGAYVTDCICGIGLNINQTCFTSDAPNPISLAQIIAAETDREAVLNRIIEAFKRYLERIDCGDYRFVSSLYKASLYRKDGFHTYRDSHGLFEATIDDVKDNGHLVLKDRTGQRHTYAFKEVTFIIGND